MEKITLEQRFARALMISAAGGAVAWALMMQEPALQSEWSIVRCALAGAFLAGLMLARGFGGTGARRWFRAGFFFSLATVMGGCMAILLLPVELMLAEMGIWQNIGLSAFKPFAGPGFALSFIQGGGLIVLIWLAGLGAAALTAPTQTAPTHRLAPRKVTFL